MPRIHTHYDNLKVARDAPREVIRAAYKTLSQKYHPDRNPGSQEAIRIIQIINSAYEVLSDPAKRKEHDEWIARTEAQQCEGADKPKLHHSSGSSRKQHRSGSTGHVSRHKSARKTFKAWQKARSILHRFSRYLFGRV